MSRFKYLIISFLFIGISCKKNDVKKMQLVFDNIEPCCKNDVDCDLFRSKSLTFKNLKGVIDIDETSPNTLESYTYYFFSDTLQSLPVTVEQLPNYKYDTQGNYIGACNMPDEIKLSKKDLKVKFDARFIWTPKKPADCECATLLVELIRIEIIE
jgi:hypothetical protein